MRSRIRVLFVDDDEHLLETLATHFEIEDDRFAVTTLSDPATAVEYIHEESVDCVISDYAMESMDGIELLETIRESFPELPFVLFTMRGSEQIAGRAIEAGATDYIRKRNATKRLDVLANRVRNAVEQYRAKQAAQQSQQRLEELTEKATDVLWTFGSEWDELLFVNSAVGDVYGISPEELDAEPQSFLDAVHPDDRDDVETAMQGLSNGEAFRGEYRVNESDDYERWVWVDSKPVFEDGEVARIVGFSRDITDRKARVSELESIKERYQAYVENASDVITVLEKDGTIAYQSPSLERVLGYTPEELIDENAFDFVHPDDREYVAGQFFQFADGETTRGESLQFRFQHADGSWIWLEVAASNQIDTAVEGYVVTSRDITDRKEREQTLSALHDAAHDIEQAETHGEVYTILTETAEEVLEFELVAVDIEEDGTLVQSAWTIDRDELDSYEVTSLEDDDTFAVRAYNRQETIVVDDLAETEITPADPTYRSVLTVPIGEYGTFQAVSAEVAGFDRGDVEFAEHLVDHARIKLQQLDQRQALEDRTQELKRQNERLDEFVSVVSHDLRNPVTVARGRLDLLQAEADNEHLRELDWAVDRMETLIDDLLTLAREGEQIDDREPIDLEHLFESSQRSVDTSDAEIDTDAERTIVGDTDRCKQLVENLLRNAIDHADDGYVEITLGDFEDGFYIADDGPGIPEDERDRVFETGYSTAEEGTGFGLNIVEEIANAHGWSVGVTDSRMDGARFEITDVEFVGAESQAPAED